MLADGRDHAGAVPLGARSQPLRLKPGQHLHADPAAVLLLVRDRRARARLRREHRARGRAAGLHDDRAALPARREQGDPRDADLHDDPAAAIVSVEPGTGAIRAMTAVIPGNTKNQFNLAAQSARQAGLDVQVVRARRRRSRRASTRTRPTTPRRRSRARRARGAPATTRPGKPWQVTTYDHTYVGSTSITHATLRSDNTVYAQLTLDVGPDYVWRMAKRLGVHLTQKPVASIGLGPLSVSPLEMAAAYATFASGGIYARPTAITKVVLPGGKVDTTAGWGKPQTQARALRTVSPGRSTQVLGAERAATAPAPARATASIRTPARRARPRTTPTPGSSATRATSRRRSGWAIRSGEIPMLSVHGQPVAGATFPVPM